MNGRRDEESQEEHEEHDCILPRLLNQCEDRRCLTTQSSEPRRAFGYALSHIDRRVEVPCFLPQPSRLFRLSRVLFEYRQRSNRVREIERGSSLVAAIKCDRLAVAPFGHFHATRILMDVTQMSHRVRQCERVI